MVTSSEHADPRRKPREAHSIQGQWCALAFALALLGGTQSVTASNITTTAADCSTRSSPERGSDAGRAAVQIPGSDKADSRQRIAMQIAPGDSLEALFKARRISRASLYEMLTNKEIANALRDLRPGDRVEIEVADDRLTRLLYQPDPWRYLEVARAGRDYQSTWFATCPERRIETASVVVTSSLYEAGRVAGISSQLVLRLVDIFAPVMDLSQGLHPGDRVSVVYERLLSDGDSLTDGAVLAAELSAGGRKVRLFRHADDIRVDYYRTDGTTVLGAGFARPVRTAAITSRFSKARRHPVLGRVRAHKGLDFGARPGTPVVATADGRIAFKGRQRGYGRTLIIDHGVGRATLYAHLSRFSSGLREKMNVRKGDTIGYVGRSGLASGSNLHYEVRINGVPVDPRLHDHDSDAHLVGAKLREFDERIRPLVKQLDALSRAAMDENT